MGIHGRQARRVTVTFVLAAVGLTSLLLAEPAHAKIICLDDVEKVPGHPVKVHRRCWDDGTGTQPTPSTGPASVDELELVDAAEELLPTRRFPACNPTTQTPAVGEVHVCSHGAIPAPPEPAGTAADPEAIARRAAAQLLAQPGTVGILPARTLTGLPTYYWLDGTGRRQTTRTQAGLTLHIQATPVAYEWAFGDDTIVHGGPGADGPPGTSDIRHVYRRSDHYQVTATVTWSVTFGLNGQTYELPDAFTTTATTDLAVDQLRARLTG